MLSTPDFLRTFYDLFMGFSEEIRAKFRQTDFTRQTRVLADSVYAMAVVGQGERESPSWAEVEQLGRQHACAQLQIRPELYDVWLDCLVKAAKSLSYENTTRSEPGARE